MGPHRFRRGGVDRVDPAFRELGRSEAGFARHGTWALALCRFVPGTRQPTFLTAGLSWMSVVKFGVVTGLMSLLWVGAIFWLVRRFGEGFGMFIHSPAGADAMTAAAVLALLVGLTARRWLPARRRRGYRRHSANYPLAA